MSLQWIAIIFGVLATAGGMVGVIRPNLIKRFAELFPRSTIPAWILTALCCFMGAREASAMNMGAVDVIKPYIPIIAVCVFAASIIFMKELLAPRALGGFLCLIAVPICRTAAMSGSPLFQVLTVVIYLLMIYGIIILMSPWYFRKFYHPFMVNKGLFRAAALGKILMGLIILALGIFCILNSKCSHKIKRSTRFLLFVLLTSEHFVGIPSTFTFLDLGIVLINLFFCDSFTIPRGQRSHMA